MAERISIRVDIFERAFKRYQKKPGASFARLAREMRVPAAQLREWRRLGEVPADKLHALASVLGIEPALLIRSQDGAITQSSVSRLGHNLLAVARTFRSYTRFLGTSRVHPGYEHHALVHHPGDDSFYGTFFLETTEAEQEWLFSVWFGLRMDYGYVRLQPGGQVRLEPILQEQPSADCAGFAAENDDGSAIVSVRTWFGRPACDFVIQSRQPFSLRWTRQAIEVPGAVTFIRNPFQKDE